MPCLSPETRAALRAAGLHVADAPFFPPDHVAWPDGDLVIKPVRAAGNALPGYRAGFRGLDGVDDVTDAPAVHVWWTGEAWGLEVAEWAPGPGPGDFRRVVRTELALIRALRAYFFGADKHFTALRADRLRRS